MGLSTIKGQLAAAFTAALIAITPAAHASTIAPENNQNQHITTTQFEAGQCYSDSDIENYLSMNGETEIMQLDKVGVVNVRVNTPLGPQVTPRKFDQQYILTADHDSWSIIQEMPNNQNCIVMQGTDLDYVSIDNQYFTQISDSTMPAATQRERVLDNLAERYGETAFITGTLTNGQIIDITTSLRGGWSVAVSNADGSGTKMTIDGFNFSLTGPEFHDRFDMFHHESTKASETMVQVIPETKLDAPQI